MDPLDQLRSEVTHQLNRIEDKIDRLRDDVADHGHGSYVTFPWFIGTGITFLGVFIGVLIAVAA